MNYKLKKRVKTIHNRITSYLFSNLNGKFLYGTVLGIGKVTVPRIGSRTRVFQAQKVFVIDAPPLALARLLNEDVIGVVMLNQYLISRIKIYLIFNLFSILLTTRAGHDL